MEKNWHYNNELNKIRLNSYLSNEIESVKVDFKLLLSKYAKDFLEIDEILIKIYFNIIIINTLC